MSDVPGLKRGVRHASVVAGIARPFESVHQDQLAARYAVRNLRVHQNAHPRLCLINDGLHRPVSLALGTPPEVPCERGEMGILKERIEGLQGPFYASLRPRLPDGTERIADDDVLPAQSPYPEIVALGQIAAVIVRREYKIRPRRHDEIR